MTQPDEQKPALIRRGVLFFALALVLLVLGTALVFVGLWEVYRPLALVVVGLFLLWLARNLAKALGVMG